MAVDLSRKTASDQVLNIVSVTDDAIDWEKSFPDLSDIAARKEKYKESHALSELVYFADKSPTVFVFKHPKRLDVNRNILKNYASARNNSDLEPIEEMYHMAYMGLKDGLNGLLDESGRSDAKRVKAEFLQALLDANIFQELPVVVFQEYSKAPENHEKK